MNDKKVLYLGVSNQFSCIIMEAEEQHHPTFTVTSTTDPESNVMETVRPRRSRVSDIKITDEKPTQLG